MLKISFNKNVQEIKYEKYIINKAQNETQHK